jgi:hypothetical protein
MSKRPTVLITSISDRKTSGGPGEGGILQVCLAYGVLLSIASNVKWILQANQEQ